MFPGAACTGAVPAALDRLAPTTFARAPAARQHPLRDAEINGVETERQSSKSFAIKLQQAERLQDCIRCRQATGGRIGCMRSSTTLSLHSPLIVCSLGTDRLAVAAAKLAARPFTIAEPVQGFLAGLTLWVAGTAPVVEGYEDGAR